MKSFQENACRNMRNALAALKKKMLSSPDAGNDEKVDVKPSTWKLPLFPEENNSIVVSLALKKIPSKCGLNVIRM